MLPRITCVTCARTADRGVLATWPSMACESRSAGGRIRESEALKRKVAVVDKFRAAGHEFDDPELEDETLDCKNVKSTSLQETL